MASTGTRRVQGLAELHADCANFLRAAGKSDRRVTEWNMAADAAHCANESREHEARLILADTLFADRVKGGGGHLKEYLALAPATQLR